jgi:hypothetical protein
MTDCEPFDNSKKSLRNLEEAAASHYVYETKALSDEQKKHLKSLYH